MGIFDFLKRKKNVPAPQAANTAPARLPDSAKACAWAIGADTAKILDAIEKSLIGEAESEAEA